MRRTGPVLFAVLGLLALPAFARADLYVQSGANPGNTACTQAAPCDTLAKAETAAAAGDTVRIGAGTFSGSLYDTKRLNLVGAGSGAADAAPGPGDTVITGNLALADAGSVAGLRVEGAVLRLGSAATTGTRIVPVSDVVVRTTNVGLLVYDEVAGGTLRVEARRSAVVQTGASAFEAVSVPGPIDTGGDPAELLLDHTTVDAHNYGVAGLAATFDLVDSRVTTDDPGRAAVINGGGTTSLLRTQVLGPALGVYESAAGTIRLRDSSVLIRNTPSVVGGSHGVLLPAGGGNAEIIGSTVYAAGAKVQSGVLAPGVASLTIRNSVVRGTGTGGARDVIVSGGTFTLSHSAASTLDRDGQLTPVTTADGNVPGDPGLVDPAGGNLRPTAGSPLIDRGDPAVPLAGELDLAGAGRALDGDGDCSAVPDIGAYEAAAVANPACSPAPPAPPPAPPTAGATTPRDTTPPAVGAARVTTGGGTAGTAATLTFDLGEPATVEAVLERAAGGAAAARWRPVATLLKRRLGAGRQTIRVPRRVKGRRLARGRYRIRLTVRDAAGNTTRRTLAFRLRR
ncbi:MAG: hypothetical protein U0R70_19090 [Solirubrobacteraceae bacterium]